MAVGVRAVTSNIPTGQTTNVSLTKPTGTATGDLLVAFHFGDSGTTNGLTDLTAPSGWTLAGSSGSATSGYVKIWWKAATASEPASYSFPGSTASDEAGVLVCYTGADTVTPFASGPTFATGTSSATHTAPSIAGIVDGMLTTAHFASGATNALRSYTAPAGMTEQADIGNASSWVGMAVFTLPTTSTASTGTKAATANRSDPWTAAALVVEPAGTPALVTGVTATATVTGPAGTVSVDLTITGGVTATATADAPAGLAGVAMNVTGVLATATTTAPAGTVSGIALITGETALVETHGLVIVQGGGVGSGTSGVIEESYTGDELVQLVTVSGTFIDDQGLPIAGKVLFRPKIAFRIWLAEKKVVTFPSRWIPLDETGSFSVNLPVTVRYTWTCELAMANQSERREIEFRLIGDQPMINITDYIVE